VKFKIAASLLILSLTQVLRASPLEQRLTIKERLRISLWKEGLRDGQGQSTDTLKKSPSLPEEIERSLRKL
jgi:hypothetical protein